MGRLHRQAGSEEEFHIERGAVTGAVKLNEHTVESGYPFRFHIGFARYAEGLMEHCFLKYPFSV